MTAPKVTYILPTIRARWVDKTIDSVLAQSLEDWEMIVMDKNHTVVKHPDPRIRVIDRKMECHSQCIQTARDMARSDIILLIFDDDIDMPHRAQYIYDKMTADPSIDVFVGSYVEMTEDGVAYNVVESKPWDYDAYLNKGLNMPLFCSGFRNTCPAWRDDFSLLADYTFFTDCALEGKKIVTDPEILARIRQHPGQANRTDRDIMMKMYWDLERVRYCRLYGVERINR
jgi:glycosyltransferase involved in cell wall biosynthesis